MAYDVMRMLNSPLIMRGNARERDFFSLVLAECALYGVPPDAIALFRDLHAMLGYSTPLAEKQIAALSGPLTTWRSRLNQPDLMVIEDIERLAFHQRALIAFGGGKPGEMIGRAEICHAMANLMKHDPKVPAEYQEVYQWAAVDTLSFLQGIPKEDALKNENHKGWKAIPDEDVVQPGGRLYMTYQEICTKIRRETIASLERKPSEHPRLLMRPWAAMFVRDHARVREQAVLENLTTVVEAIDQQIAAIHRMFPDLGSIDEELHTRTKDAIREIKGEIGI